MPERFLLSSPRSSYSSSRPASWRGNSLRGSAAKMSRVRKVALLAFVGVACAVLLSGCVATVFSAASAVAGAGSAYWDYKTSQAAEPVVVAPDIVDYSDAVQSRAADELEQLGKPCPADDVIADCSAAARMILDYGRMREQVRATK